MAFRLWSQIKSVKYLQHGSLKPCASQYNSSLISTPEPGNRNYSDSKDYGAYRALKGRVVRHAPNTTISEDENFHPTIRYRIVQGTDLVTKNQPYKPSNICHIKYKLADKPTTIDYEDSITAMRKEFHRQQCTSSFQPCSMKPFNSKETRCFEMEKIPSGKFLFGRYPRRGMATKSGDEKNVNTDRAEEAEPIPDTLSIDSENVTISLEDTESTTKKPPIIIEEGFVEVESTVSAEPIEHGSSVKQVDSDMKESEISPSLSIDETQVEAESMLSSEPAESIPIKHLDHKIIKPIVSSSSSTDKVEVDIESIMSSETVEPVPSSQQDFNELMTPVTAPPASMEEQSVQVKPIVRSERTESAPDNESKVATLSSAKKSTANPVTDGRPIRYYSTATRRSKAKRLPIKSAHECGKPKRKKREKTFKHDAAEPWVKCECCPEMLPCDKATYISLHPFPCPNVDYPQQGPGEFKKPSPPPMPTQMPTGRLVKRPVLQKVKSCNPGHVPKLCYYMEPKSLPEFPKETCPCVEPYLPTRLPVIKYIKKHVYQCVPQCNPARCQTTKYITLPKKLPDIIPGDCPCITPTFTDAAPLKRLHLNRYQKMKECKAPCVKKPMPRIVNPKCLPRFRNNCVCIEAKPLKPVKLVRLPHVCVCPKPPDPKCYPEKPPLRADDVCKWKFPTKKLKNWWCPNPKMPKQEEFCTKSRKIRENIQ